MAATKPQLTARPGRPRPAALVAALAALVVAGCGSDAPAPARPSPAADRPSTMPRSAVDYVHRTFHRLPRSCGPQRTDRRQLDLTTSRFLDLYRRFPPRLFDLKIDDEPGTMLSVLLILRDELSRCSPRHAARIDPALPDRVRRALRPLPTGSG